MRAYRDEAPVAAREDRRGIFVIAVVGAAVVILTLLYFGLRDTGEAESTAVTMPVLRDVEAPAALNSAEVAPPAVQQAAPDGGDFNERQLGPPSTTVGAGEAPAANTGENGEVFVIDGELLEQLEADAENAAEAHVE